jgi:2'-5' RNA ligase
MPAQDIYDDLWHKAAPQFRAGQVQLDPYLRQRQTDPRQGITLIARPGPNISARFSRLLDDLRQLEPGQHFYRPDEFHLTVLTLISASAQFKREQTPLAAYQTIFADLFRQARPFQVEFRGITASPAAIMAQGYVKNDDLNQLRGAVRQALQAAELAHHLDTRYRISTAHVTLMRFTAPLTDAARFLARLDAARHEPFGAAEINQLEFVLNDWYMSHDKVEVLGLYPL